MATGRIGTNTVLTTRWSKAPAGGTTSLSGLDDNSVSLVYSVGYEQVYRNGVLLSRGNDYTATNGTTITLIDATITGDIIEVFANATIPLTDTYSQTVANGKFINNTLTTTTGDIIYASAANTPARLGIGSTDQVLKVSGGVPAWATPSSGALTLVKTASFSSVADTGTTFNTVFSATYDYYILQLSVKGSTTANLLFQIRSGSTTRTANYYGSSAFVAPSSSTLTNSGSNGTSSWDLMDIGSAFESIASLTLNYRQTTLPFISGTFNSIISNTTGFCGLLVDNGSFDGFILSASTGNITGSASVYGLAKS